MCTIISRITKTFQFMLELVDTVSGSRFLLRSQLTKVVQSLSITLFKLIKKRNNPCKSSLRKAEALSGFINACILAQSFVTSRNSIEVTR